MPPSGYFIDANLLVLYVAGRTGIELIAKHRRLRGYTVEDFEILLDEIDRVEQVFVTPNTLTETSNLLGQHADPERALLLDTLQAVIHGSKEVVVQSAVASSRSEFNRLGLTDSALLEVASEETPVITVDLDLYLAALQKGQNTAVNFTHLRNL